ncbi:hypothetical protein X975_24424, partial [Stegodyphus mimosarum]
MRKKWITLCHRADKFNPNTSYICSDHFLVTDFERDMRNELLGLSVRRKLVQNAFPSLKIKPERTFAMANERSQRIQLKEQKEVCICLIIMYFKISQQRSSKKIYVLICETIYYCK